jgi:cation diffusion facilitator family transporter
MENRLELHYKKIRRVLLAILGLNWLVALVKIAYGSATRCESMTADGFHSLADGASNIIGLIGIHFACQPVDKDHPYGHRKYETFFALGIAAMLFVVAFNLGKEGVLHLFNPPPAPHVDMNSFIVMLVTMGINTLVMVYERRRGRELRSDILLSDSMHTGADIFTSVSVIAALIVIKMGFPLLDPIVTILISIFIAHAGYDIVKQSSNVLCDTAAILDLQKIESIVLGTSGVKSCHKIRSRGRPDDIHIDLHVQVNPDMHVDNAHKLSYAIEEAIKRGVPEVTDVVVHIEPEEKA